MTRWMLVLAVVAWPSLAAAQTPTARSPSPMADATRAHERLGRRELRGMRRSFAGPAGRPVELWIPDRVRDGVDLVVHFHGAAWVAEEAAARLRDRRTVTAVLNLGAGSGAYGRPFTDPAAFDSLLAGVAREASAAAGRPVRIRSVTLSGFSAGYGAVRAILREPRHFATVGAVLLLDGLHASYVPEGSGLAAGGVLDTTNLDAFAAYARAAVRGEKRFVVTHSEIFPGTFASTTESADWLLGSLGIRRVPVLRWGPRGMQQLSEARARGFEVLGFAGNSAPDHIDHLHAIPEFLARALR
ncbi:MAG TPA: hypothetical protein VE913_15535, partial [Longimicrobium sp.]|nr:hypothetical protein [Longimicrobium sp.]